MKKLVLTIFFVLSIGLSFTSCTKDMNFGSPQEAKEYQYTAAFENKFGEISKTQSWGFPKSNKSLTRAAQPNGNQWGTHDNNDMYWNYPQPAPITEQELNDVLNVFNQKGATSYEPLIHWENFFIQQVYTGPNGWKMNELATTVDYVINTNVICWWPYQEEVIRQSVNPFDDIINNFNNGNCYAWNGCMLMFNSATEDFSFKTSQSGGQRIYGHWRMEKINGNYYVGFDHEAWKQAPANANEEDKRDYIYNDWIIKIVPGKDYVEPEDKVKEQGRIICEDLGGIGDFDFNDVVFDATIYESGKTEITVQAAGGELPISVAGKDISSVMGYMVNTIEDGPTHEPYTFVSDYTYNSLIDIPILVFHRDAAHHMYVTELKAEMGSAPQKICVPTTFKWCKEHNEHSIDKAYKGFTTWVNEGQEWYNTDTPEELIHRY